MFRVLLLGSFLGLTAALCTDAQMCASGAVAGSNIVGYVCLEMSGATVTATYGNTLDPQCLGGDQSCVAGTTALLTQADCTTPKIWAPTTCSAVQQNTPSSNCGFIITASLTPYATQGGAAACCVNQPAANPPSAPAADPCFPNNALVTLADGTTKRIDTLSDGDVIVAATADGAMTTDAVSMLLSISKPEAEAAFITVTTNGGRALNLTADHHLPVGAACCSNLKKAADVVVGDKLWVVGGTGAPVAQEVTKLTKVIAKGLHSPVLAHGTFPVVNGVVTSFDSIGKVTLASYGLGPALKACEATNTCDMLRYILLGNK